MRLPRRGQSRPAPGADLSGLKELDLIDVTLSTEYEGQPAEVPGLALGFDSVGMTVRREDGSKVVTIPWGAINGLSTDSVTPQRHSLSTAVVLDVHTYLSSHRFLIPNVQPSALTGLLSALSSRYGHELTLAQGKGQRH